MTKKRTGSVSMAENKQVVSVTKPFWFSDGTVVEAETAAQAAKLKQAKTNK